MPSEARPSRTKGEFPSSKLRFLNLLRVMQTFIENECRQAKHYPRLHFIRCRTCRNLPTDTGVLKFKSRHHLDVTAFERQLAPKASL